MALLQIKIIVLEAGITCLEIRTGFTEFVLEITE